MTLLQKMIEAPLARLRDACCVEGQLTLWLWTLVETEGSADHIESSAPNRSNCPDEQKAPNNTSPICARPRLTPCAEKQIDETTIAREIAKTVPFQSGSRHNPVL
jgi:hypothetical protein